MNLNILFYLIIQLGSFSPTDDYQHYEIVVDNSLFYPLGWVEPKPRIKWKLVGVVNDKAYFFNTTSYRISVFSRGDSLGNNEIGQINNKKVGLKNGVTYELPATEFLTRSDKRNKRSSSRSSKTVRSESQTSKREGRPRKRTTKNTGRSRENLRKRWETFQSASPEERERMIEEFRKSRRN